MLTIFELALKKLGCCSLASNSPKVLGRQYLQISALHFSSVSIIHWQQQLQARCTQIKHLLERGHSYFSIFENATSSISNMFFNIQQSLWVISTHIIHTSATCYESSALFSTLFSVTVTTSSSRQCAQHETWVIPFGLILWGEGKHCSSALLHHNICIHAP